MKKRIICTAVVAAICSTSPAMAGQPKMDICHFTGNDRVVVINIPVKAANAHIWGHDDFIPNTFYEDNDGDGFGNPDVSLKSCDETVSGFVLNGDDNDDTDGLVSEVAIKGGRNKTALCHFDTRDGFWNLISVAGPAVAAHLRNHDDALPGNQTSKTQALLDLQCALCQEITVLDNFQQSSFGNSDGPDDWAGNWVENDPESGGAGPAAGQVQVIDGALRLDDYPDTGGQPSAARAVDLSGGGNATFSFDFRTTSGVDSNDAIAVEVSSDGGGTWTELQIITGVVGEISDSRSYDVSAFASYNTVVRFRVAELYGGSGEFFFVDNIEIKSSCSN